MEYSESTGRIPFFTDMDQRIRRYQESWRWGPQWASCLFLFHMVSIDPIGKFGARFPQISGPFGRFGARFRRPQSPWMRCDEIQWMGFGSRSCFMFLGQSYGLIESLSRIVQQNPLALILSSSPSANPASVLFTAAPKSQDISETKSVAEVRFICFNHGL